MATPKLFAFQDHDLCDAAKESEIFSRIYKYCDRPNNARKYEA